MLSVQTQIYALGGLALFMITVASAIIAQPERRSVMQADFPLTARARAILAIALILFIAQGFAFFDFVVDDVFISLRYARNLAAGHGMVFNTDGSAPVEGYTNFLWILVEAPLFLLSRNPDTVLSLIKLIGLFFGVGVIWLVWKIGRSISGDAGTGAIAALFLAALPEFAMWSVGGLETPMYIFWLLAGIYRFLLERRGGKPPLLSMLLFFLATLTRPEGLLATGGMLAWSFGSDWLENRNTPGFMRSLVRRMGGGLLLFLALLAAYEAWRWSYYGDPLPNTFYAKKPAGFAQLFHRFKQVGGFTGRLMPLFTVGIWGYIVLRTKRPGESRMLVWMIGLFFLLCFAVRNEWMPGYRYELPFVPLLALIFAEGLRSLRLPEALVARSPSRDRFYRFLTVWFLGLFMFHNFDPLRQVAADFAQPLRRAHIPLGEWLRQYAPPESSFAGWDMGAVPFYAGLDEIIDINSEGLLNPQTTRGSYDVEGMLARKPDFLVLPPKTEFVRPPDILRFYDAPAFIEQYVFLFTVYYDSRYQMHVFKRQELELPPGAVESGRALEEKTRLSVF